MPVPHQIVELRAAMNLFDAITEIFKNHGCQLFIEHSIEPKGDNTAFIIGSYTVQTDKYKIGWLIGLESDSYEKNTNSFPVTFIFSIIDRETGRDILELSRARESEEDVWDISDKNTSIEDDLFGTGRTASTEQVLQAIKRFVTQFTNFTD